MMSHAFASRTGVAGTLLATGWLLVALSLAPIASGVALRVESASASQEDLDFPSGITLNEFMPDPNLDWNDDGTVSDTSDEYIEIYNDGSAGDVDLSGWKLDDIAGGGSSEYVFPPNTILRAGLPLVMFSADTRVGLNNSGGDTVRLVRPDNSEADTFHYTTTAPDQAYSRTIDGSGTWTTTYPPSPGAVNQPVSPPTPSPTPPSTDTPSPSPSSTPTATPSPTAGPPPTPFPTGISLNEYMPDPVTDWNGNGQTGDADDEYIELYNAGLVTIEVSGWFLDDIANGGSPPYELPAGTLIPPNGFLLVFSAQTHIALNNGGDTVRLVRPDGVEIETASYASSHADQAYSKTIDGSGDWTATYPPSPGGPNQPPPPSPTPAATVTPIPSNTPATTASPSPTPAATPTATTMGSTTPTPYPGELSLNEFMPDPASDWNGNGQTGDADDEYIEIYNDSELPADVSGWLLDDVDGGGSPPFALPLGTSIPPAGFLVLFSAQTHLSLNNGGDSVRLVRPDGVEVEVVSYTVTRADQAHSKTVDGGAEWTTVYPPSPGASNQPQPTATPTATIVPTTASVSGHVFLDADSDGQFEPWQGETGLANVLVMLNNGRLWMTDPSGWYGFHNLAPGSYLVRQAQPVHTSSTTPDEYTVALAAGDDRNNLHFGEMPLPPGQVHTPVLLNEFLPSPASDWDGDGTATAEDEWIELHNPSDAWVDLSGWFLDDVDDSRAVSPEGSAPYAMPPGSQIAPNSYKVVFRSTSGVALNNSGDTVRLLGPGLFELETNSFGSTQSDIAWSKTVDGGNEWTNAYPPSLGTSNQPALTATPTATTVVTATATPTVTPTPAGFPEGVSLNEYLADPASDWDGDGFVTAEDEYIEIYNSNTVAVDLSGWILDDVDDGPSVSPDGSRPYVLPPGSIVSAHGFLTLFRSQSGVVLNNDGDWVRLLRSDGLLVEATIYATSHDDEAYSKTLDGGDQWTHDYPPSPGHTNLLSTPTPTATATGGPTPDPTVTGTVTTTATVTPTPSSTPDPSLIDVTLNEFMPDPASDWNGDGTATQDDEYIELFNAGSVPVDLGGWMLDDVDDSQNTARFYFAPDGSRPYVIPAGTVVDPGGFVLFFRSETDVTLNNDDDWVRLLRPDGVVVEAFEYTSSRDDQAYSKTLDGGDEWTRTYPPSPGRSNTVGGTPTPSPTASPSATRTQTPSPTPSGTPQPLPTEVSLNEAMPWPASDWNGDGQVDSGDEYIELYNAGGQAIDLGGWKLDDSAASAQAEVSSPYVIPSGTILPAKSFLLFFGSQTHVGLNNNGDSVRLLWPDGMEVERFVYEAATWGSAFSKEKDGGQSWTATYPPSPGQSNSAGFTGNERVRLNELLSSPKEVDWDGDGAISYLDEWIEIVNMGEEPVRLAGWALVEGPDASTGHRYVLPADTSLEAGQYLVIYRGQSRLALDAGEETVHLLFPDGSSADTTHYTNFAGYDQSWCRLPNGTGGWSAACIETPGRANLADVDSGGNGGGDDTPLPPYDRFNHGQVSIAWARTLPDDTRVTLEGQVTVPPDIFDDQQIYIQDATGGMLVYLRSGEWPPLSEGQWVRVNGWLDTLYSEKEIKLTRIDDIKTMQPAAPPAPRLITSGDVGEATEGWLVRIIAPASGFRGRSVVLLDNGGSDAAVVFKQSTGLLRPYVEIGELWAVVGVVSQDDDEAPFDSGYRLLPRHSADVQPGAKVPTTSAPVLGDATWNAVPLFLPVTGVAGSSPSYSASWTQQIRPVPAD